jgi:hypothetical protein
MWECLYGDYCLKEIADFLGKYSRFFRATNRSLYESISPVIVLDCEEFEHFITEDNVDFRHIRCDCKSGDPKKALSALFWDEEEHEKIRFHLEYLTAEIPMEMFSEEQISISIFVGISQRDQGVLYWATNTAKKRIWTTEAARDKQMDSFLHRSGAFCYFDSIFQHDDTDFLAKVVRAFPMSGSDISGLMQQSVKMNAPKCRAYFEERFNRQYMDAPTAVRTYARTGDLRKVEECLARGHQSVKGVLYAFVESALHEDMEMARSIQKYIGTHINFKAPENKDDIEQAIEHIVWYRRQMLGHTHPIDETSVIWLLEKYDGPKEWFSKQASWLESVGLSESSQFARQKATVD